MSHHPALPDTWSPACDLAVLLIAIGSADQPITRSELDAAGQIVRATFHARPSALRLPLDDVIAAALEHHLLHVTPGVGDSPDGWLVRHAVAVREAVGDEALQDLVVRSVRVARAGGAAPEEVQVAAGFAAFWERPDLARAMLHQFSRARSPS